MQKTHWYYDKQGNVRIVSAPQTADEIRRGVEGKWNRDNKTPETRPSSAFNFLNH